MTKLNPWTMPPSSVPASETNVRTPRTSPRELTAGPPLLPHAAGASVWMTGWFVTSCLNPEIAPLVTDASTLADALRSSWLSTTPGKPRTWSLSPIWALAESASESVGMSAVSSLSRARSRPDMLWPVTGGLPVGGRHDVGVGDHPSARADEPAGACFAEGRGANDLLSAPATGHEDFRADLRDNERNGRLRAEQGFLHGELRGCRGGRKKEKERTREPKTHLTHLIPPTEQKKKAPGGGPGAFGGASGSTLRFRWRLRPSPWPQPCCQPCTRPRPRGSAWRRRRHAEPEQPDRHPDRYVAPGRPACHAGPERPPYRAAPGRPACHAGPEHLPYPAGPEHPAYPVAPGHLPYRAGPERPACLAGPGHLPCRAGPER